MNTNSTPAALPFWLTPEYIAEKARKRHIRNTFGTGKHGRQRHTEYVYKIVQKLIAKGLTKKDIATRLNTDNVPRYGRPLPWVASSVRQVLKDHAREQQEAAERRLRLAQRPKYPLLSLDDMTDDELTPTNPNSFTTT